MSPPELASALYRGGIRHRRLGALPHTFRYPLFMLYLDLDELPRLFDGRWLWSVGRPNLAWFRRADYLGDPRTPLDQSVRELVAERTGLRPAGPIRLLTNLRTLGVVMNPVSFYFCFAPGGERVEAIVAEVTNTPWKERHAYVLAAPSEAPAGATQRFALSKELHVSPFMAMGFDYDWRFSAPGRRLVVHMENHGAQGKAFDATLVLAREPLAGPNLARALWRHPWISAQIVWRIYWQALRLYSKGVPFHTHPKKLVPDNPTPDERRTDVSLPGAR